MTTPKHLRYPSSRVDYLVEIVLLAAAAIARRYLKRRAQFRIAVLPRDLHGQEIFARGLYEREELEFCSAYIFRFAKDGPGQSVAVDVGANIGNHTLLFSQYFDRVIAFEPNPSAYKILEANLELNRIANVELVRKGLSDQSDELVFYEDINSNLAASRFGERYDMSAPCIERRLSVVTGDGAIQEMLGDHDRIVFIKVDVEGFERKVFEGLRNTLDMHHPYIMFENRGGETGNALLQFLKDMNYRHFYAINREGSNERNRFVRTIKRFITGPALTVTKVILFSDSVHPCVIASEQPLVLEVA